MSSARAFVLLLAVIITTVAASFTQTTCWANNCIQLNTKGTWCYIPAAGATRATTCTGPSADYAGVLEKHLEQGLSVAYYNGAGDSFVGGAGYSIPDTPGVIRLCMSGQSGDGNFQTTCVNVAADNTIPTTGGCTVIRAQRNVTDGCYDPNFTGLSTLTPTPSSTPPSTVTSTKTAVSTTSVTVTTTTITQAQNGALPFSQFPGLLALGTIFLALLYGHLLL
ncbi:hypothetical protein DFP72DRAFT_1146108 [Ephemerocybe angulata]|uniref:Uncharacterized protein n=1 Tax=Ephemerocybe angulata TaxID=980116 RepID=A0A8H6HL46_9AGAR|nr:hypothetical protein DFP72DRAFT_1146108 [Tulosesus angulatus]